MLTRSVAGARTVGAPPLAALAALAVLVAAGALVATPPLVGAALVGGAIVAAVILVQPRWGLYLLLLSIPVQDYGARGELTLTNVLFGLTLVAWLVRRAAPLPGNAGERQGPLPRSAVGPCFVLFVGVLALSMTVAQELAPGVAALFQWGKSLLVYFLALDLLRTRRHVLGALAALLLAGVSEAGLGLVQFLTGAGPASFAIGAGTDVGAAVESSFSRAFGTFGRPNSYAGYLEMLFPLGLALAVWLWRQWRGTRGARRGDTGGRQSEPQPKPDHPARWLWAAGATSAATALIGVAILVSLSRGALLGTLGGLAAMAMLAGRRSRGAALLAVLAALLFGLVGGYALVPASVQARLAGILADVNLADVRTAYVTAENFAVLEREAHWLAGLNMVSAHPFLGVGLGNFNVRFAEFTASPTFLISQGHAHNYYIQVAAESGLIGLAAYLLLLGSIVLAGVRALRATAGHDPFAHALVVAACGVVTAVAIHNVFEVLHVLSMGVQLSAIWAFFAIAQQSLPAAGGQGGLADGAVA